MAHLSLFGVSNFKVFKDLAQFELKPITILTGTNSSGKSSLTKAIRLLQQCFPEAINKPNLSLKFENENHLLGNFNTVKNSNGDNEIISFTLPFKWWGLPDEMTLTMNFIENNDSKEGLLQSAFITLDSDDSEIVSFELEETLPISIHLNKPTIEFGTNKYSRNINLGLLRDLFEKTALKSIKTIHTLNEFVLLHQKEYPLNPNDYPLYIKDNKLVLDESYDLIKDESKNKILELIEEWNENSDSVNFFKNQLYSNIEKEISSFKSKKIYFHSLVDLIFSWDVIIKKDVLRNEFRDNLKNILPSSLKIISDRFPFSYINFDFPLLDYNFLTKENLPYYKNDIELIKELELTNDWFQNKNLLYITEFPDRMVDLTHVETHIGNEKILGSYCLLNIYSGLKDKLEIELSFDDISYGINYYSIVNELVRKGMEKSFSSLKSIFNKNNIAYAPAMRSSPTRFFNTNNNYTFLDELIHEVKLKDISEERLLFFKEYVDYFNIAEDVKIKPIEDTGLHKIILIKNGKELNISDVGYGHAQILPLLMKSIFFPDLSIFIIEEPETNLHPALQSKLADFFIACYEKFGIQFIIETHSEYLIRKLQMLIGQKKFSNNDANLYYFYPPDQVPDDQPQIKKINFEKSGILNESFGKGFFDEADNLSISLFTITNAQKN